MHQQDLCKNLILGQYMPPEGWCVITMTINVHRLYECVVTANTKLNQWIRALLPIDVATSYKPIVNPLCLARLYNHIQSGLTLPPDFFLSCMLACVSIIIVFTTNIIAKSVPYRLSRQHVTTYNLQEHQTGKPTKTNLYQTRCKDWHKRQQSYMSTLPSIQIMMLATSMDQYQQPNSFSVDTDGVYFIINNSASDGICNIKSMLLEISKVK